jgi:hypothetical protein
MHLRIFTLPEAFYSDPVHRTAIASILLHNEWKVIFHCTGGNTSLAAGAYILVNDHPPFAFSLFSNGALRAHTV